MTFPSHNAILTSIHSVTNDKQILTRKNADHLTWLTFEYRNSQNDISQ